MSYKYNVGETVQFVHPIENIFMEGTVQQRDDFLPKGMFCISAGLSNFYLIRCEECELGTGKDNIIKYPNSRLVTKLVWIPEYCIKSRIKNYSVYSGCLEQKLDALYKIMESMQEKISELECRGR